MNPYLFLFIKFVSFILLFGNCTTKKNPPILNKSAKVKMNVIGGKFFADFNLFTLEGINEISSSTFSFPCVEVLKTNDTLYLNCHFDSYTSILKKLVKKGDYYLEIDEKVYNNQDYIGYHRYFREGYLLEFMSIKNLLGRDKDTSVMYISKYTEHYRQQITIQKSTISPRNDLDIVSIPEKHIISEYVYFYKPKKDTLNTELVVKEFDYTDSTFILTSAYKIMSEYTFFESLCTRRFSFFWNIYLRCLPQPIEEKRIELDINDTSLKVITKLE